MKIALIDYRGQVAPALVLDTGFRPIAPWKPADQAGSAYDVASFTPNLLASAMQGDGGADIPSDQVRLLQPRTSASRMICVGLNYRTHVAETRNDLPDYPTLFTKVNEAIVAPDEALACPALSEQYDYEGEICVVIGKGGRHISAERALDHVFGYSIMMDGSVRDYQRQSISAGKNFWRSGSFGPWVTVADAMPSWDAMTLETRLNGETVQSSNAGLLIYDVATCIAYISRWLPLLPGDVIATGTPGGVGSRRTPPLWMKPGDRIEVEVAGVGVLGNPIVAEAELIASGAG